MCIRDRSYCACLIYDATCYHVIALFKFLHALRFICLLWPSLCLNLQEGVCSIVGSSLTFFGLELTETPKRGDVLLLLRRKQRCLCPLVDVKYCLHYVWCLRRYSVVYNLIPRDACWIAVSKWSISYRCCRMAVYIFLLVR